jgi:lipopolysaccharide export system protein LptA
VSAAGLVLAALLTAQAPAAKAGAPAKPSAARGGEGPVRVAADEVKYAFEKREVVFTGSPVTLTRDDATLTCRRLVARNDAEGQIASATCVGDVRFARGERVVTCEKATFDNADDRLVCEGNPVLRQGGTEARGTRLVYDLRNEQVQFAGAPGKPTVVVVPGEEAERIRREAEARRKGGKP